MNIHGLLFYLPDLTSFLPDVRNDFSKVQSFIKFMQIYSVWHVFLISTGLFVVKRLTEGSVAEIDGRINVHDTLLKVFAVLHVSCLLLLKSLTQDLCQWDFLHDLP